NLVSGALSKEEFLQYKQEYSAKAENIRAAIQSWNDKLTEAIENRGDRNRWINHFLQFSEMEDIDRGMVARLIQSIIINADKSIEIRFNYQDEYQRASAFIERASEERRAV
ncbi:MAG: recombinase TnpX, partial [Eubacterium sp.]|nr:recombinase TnpX [Eubacterium sp.]